MDFLVLMMIRVTVLPFWRMDAKWISYVHIHLYSSIASQQRIPSTLDAINYNYTRPYTTLKTFSSFPFHYPSY